MVKSIIRAERETFEQTKRSQSKGSKCAWAKEDTETSKKIKRVKKDLRRRIASMKRLDDLDTRTFLMGKEKKMKAKFGTRTPHFSAERSRHCHFLCPSRNRLLRLCLSKAYMLKILRSAEIVFRKKMARSGLDIVELDT